jgi:sterol desaturase/sphingolipid hydroxylase (fatty acid hydroxylase superfamily)
VPADVGRARILDYAVLPAFAACAIAATWGARCLGLPELWISTAALAPMVGLALLLERVRPERAEYRRLDLPLGHELGHFLLGNQAGALAGYGAVVGLTSAGASLLGSRLHAPLWPSHVPLALQVVLAVLLGEAVGYWQHRLAHRSRWLWRFHAIHHSGERLNLPRAGRFHFVDIATAVFMTYLPPALLGAPPVVFTWLAVVNGTLGVIQHANVRVRTPRWLDRVICTPAVHRFHHSREGRGADGNFATTFMIFDGLFGSYVPPEGPGPIAVGIENDPVACGFWRQLAGVAPGAGPASRSGS